MSRIILVLTVTSGERSTSIKGLRTKKNMAVFCLNSLRSFEGILVLLMLLHLAMSTSETKKAQLPGMLYPRESESREVKDLSGVWNFRADTSNQRNDGLEQMWFKKPLWQVRNHGS